MFIANEGVRLLVERMKTNPEEFFEGNMSKWAYVMQMANGSKWLNEEERKALDDAANQVQRERFTAEVLKVLTTSDEQRAENARIDAYTIGAGGRAITGGVLTANTAGTAQWNGVVPQGTVSMSK